jgi:hypothetical protein
MNFYLTTYKYIGTLFFKQPNITQTVLLYRHHLKSSKFYLKSAHVHFVHIYI